MAVVGRSICIFVIAAALPFAGLGATAHDWLAGQQNPNTGFLDSYEADNSYVAYTYDQACAAIAFTAENDIVRAKKILDRMVAVQNLEGSWDDAYFSDSGAPTSTWRVTGNSIWVVMAINYYTRKTGDTEYLPAAKKCADWFLTLQTTNSASPIYGSISGGVTDVGGRIQWVSTEHNLDAYSALKNLSLLLNDPSYSTRADLVYNWITQKMWEPITGHFYVGLVDLNGNINYGEYLDIQAWGIAALGRTGPQGADYTRGISWAYSKMRLTRAFNGQNIEGFDYDGSIVSPGGGVWFEGTEQMSLAFELIGDSTNSNYYHTQAGKGQTANAGVICAVGDGGLAWPTNFPFNSVAAASWYVFASQNPKVNPFQPPTGGDTTPPAISSVASSGITQNAATITWLTSEASDSQVEYGVSTGYGSLTALDTNLVSSHSAGLSGLAAGTTYHYRVRSKDAAGNLAFSADFTFTTAGAADTTPPILSNIASGNLAPSSATVSWTTDEASDSQVDYGTTTAYGSLAAQSAMVTSHSLNLSSLSPQTLYHYRVRSRDAAGNTAVSGDFTFTTPPVPDTTPPAISSVASSNVGINSATILWSTDEAADSQVEYGLSTAYGSSSAFNPALVTAHSVNIAGLTAGTTYHYRVKSKDAAGNLAVSGDFTFSTTSGSSQTRAYASTTVAIAQGFGTPDPAALAANENTFMPVNSQQVGSLFITDWNAGVTIAEQPSSVTKLTITWSGNYTANQMQGVYLYNWTSSVWARVDYQQIGTVEQLISVVVTSPAAYISAGGQIKARFYAERVDNVAVYNDYLSFGVETNGSPADTTPPQISATQSGSVTASATTITWTTNESADSQVEYGTTTSYGSSTPLDATLVTAHSVSLSNLAGATTYHYRVKSKDAAGNLATGADATFTTLNPLTTRDYFATAVVLLQGSSLSNTGRINANDNSYMTLNSVSSGGNQVTDWYAKTQISDPRSQVRAFTITYDGKYNKTRDQGIFLYNFVSGVWARIDYQPIGTTDKTVTFRTTDLTSYLSSSGEIRVRVQGAGSGAHTCSADFVKFTIELQ